MNELVLEVTSQILTALVLGKKKRDLILLLNDADIHRLAANEPTLFTTVKTLTGEVRYFLDVPIKTLANKGSPLLVRRIL